MILKLHVWNTPASFHKICILPELWGHSFRRQHINWKKSFFTTSSFIWRLYIVWCGLLSYIFSNKSLNDMCYLLKYDQGCINLDVAKSAITFILYANL